MEATHRHTLDRLDEWLRAKDEDPTGAFVTFGCQAHKKTLDFNSLGLLKRWLGNRDSNPNYLIQNQAFYL